MADLRNLSLEDVENLAGVGIRPDAEDRSGTFLLENLHTICVTQQTKGLELLPLAEALNKYAWLSERYYWKAVRRDQDEVTARCAAQEDPRGYFVRVERGAKVAFPCQAGLYMSEDGVAQMVHNVVVLEEDAELHIITGCLTGMHVKGGVHMAITEQYIGKNASLISTMLHRWGPDVSVYPRTGTVVAEKGSFVSDYVTLEPPHEIRLSPNTWLEGAGSSAHYRSIVLGKPGSKVVSGGTVYLNGVGSSAELIHRGLGAGGELWQRGLMVGNAPCRAHVDCAGMLLGRATGGFIQAIPGLKASHPEASMSHEASIGRIAPEQVQYLQSRGMTEDQAVSMIIRGFLDTGMEGLGPELDDTIAEIADLAQQGEGSSM